MIIYDPKERLLLAYSDKEEKYQNISIWVYGNPIMMESIYRKERLSEVGTAMMKLRK